jgi:hypothetical protein
MLPPLADQSPLSPRRKLPPFAQLESLRSSAGV